MDKKFTSGNFTLEIDNSFDRGFLSFAASEATEQYTYFGEFTSAQIQEMMAHLQNALDKL